METCIGFVPIVTMVDQKLRESGEMEKEICVFLTRMPQQGKKSGQGQVEVGPELLRAAPAQVMKMRLVRQVGLGPVLQLYCFREPRG